jgi:UDP-N-acetylmuramyl pentapeptide phosphotransferase/UDP-N-acetylglucosamine-1-phosphate transferase
MAAVATAVLGAVATRAAYSFLTRHPPGGVHRWTRTNFAGHPVTLLGGPSCVAAAAAATLLAPALPRRERAAGLAAVLGAGAVGAYDDLAGSPGARGLAGHLRALRQGTVTTGTVKVAGLTASGLLAGRLVEPRVTDAALCAAMVAGASNVANLLDLRPGRALKVVLAHAPVALAGGPAGVLLAAACGPAAALMPDDLAARSMLGDAGAGALGALVGLATTRRYGTTGRWIHVAGLTVLTLASERVSFTRVIAAAPPLRWLDELGRPAAARG